MSVLHSNNIKGITYRGSNAIAAYVGSTKIYPLASPENDCYAIAYTVAEYTGDYAWLWVESENKWYRRNDQGFYEPYGVYGTSIEPYEHTDYTYVYGQNLPEALHININDRFIVDGLLTQPTSNVFMGTKGTEGNEYRIFFIYNNLYFDYGNQRLIVNNLSSEVDTPFHIEFGNGYLKGRWGDVSFNVTGDRVVSHPQAFDINLEYFKLGKFRKMNEFGVSDFVVVGKQKTDGSYGLYNNIDKTWWATIPSGFDQKVQYGETTYKGKLAIVDGVEYEWDGNKWVEIEKTVYDVCDAVFDGNSFFDTGVNGGYGKRMQIKFRCTNSPSHTIIAASRDVGATKSFTAYLRHPSGSNIQYAAGFGNTGTYTGTYTEGSYGMIDMYHIYNTASVTKNSITAYSGSSFDDLSQVGSTTGTTKLSATTADNGISIYVGGGHIPGSTIESGMTGEIRSVTLMQNSVSSSTSVPTNITNDFVFINVDGVVKMLDKVTNKLFDSVGVVTAGNVYDTINVYKTYEPKEAPENPMVFDSVEDMNAYECAFEGMKAVVDGVNYTYINGMWVTDKDYDIVDDIKNYTGTAPWVWATSNQKWYRRNDQGFYEPYGVYGNSIDPYVIDEEPLQEATFAAQSYYVTNKTASGNTRMVIDFTTPDAWASGTQFLCGTRTGSTATYMTNVGYTNTGRLRIDAGSNTFATDTYELTTGTRYILDYRTYGTNLRWILSTPDGTVLRDFSTTFSGSQVSNYPFCINTMNQGGNPLAVYAREGSKIRNVKFYYINSVNNEGTLTNDYRFIQNTCIDKVTGFTPRKTGTVSFTETGEKWLTPMGETTYKGKLSTVDGVEYEWDGSLWKEVKTKTTYNTCTAILDGDSYFTTDATVGIMRKYSMVYKPDYDDATTVMGVVGNAENRNRQSYYMEKGNQLASAVGSRYPLLATSAVFTNNTWTKVDATIVYNTDTTVNFDGTYSTGSTFDGAFSTLNTVSIDSGTVVDNNTQFIRVGGILYGSSIPFKGEMYSVKIDYDTINRTTANWQPYHNYVFIEDNGVIKLFDSVTKRIFNQEGNGIATIGSVYGSVTGYKGYEPKPAPEVI